jgi:hypothetical protein
MKVAERSSPKYLEVTISQHVPIDGITYGGNQSQIRFDFGHYVTQRMSFKAIESAQIANGGLNQPSDYPNKVNERWFHHDQIDAISSLELGGEFDFVLSPSFDISGSLIHSFVSVRERPSG